MFHQKWRAANTPLTETQQRWLFDFDYYCVSPPQLPCPAVINAKCTRSLVNAAKKSLRSPQRVGLGVARPGGGGRGAVNTHTQELWNTVTV